MSGHSKWHQIRHKKAITDSRRGNLFARLVKDITIAAQIGGGDLASNPRLRLAVQTARDASMPNKNIDNAIKKGTGELEGVSYEELVYEGYGAGGVAFIVTCTTDNKNRTASEIRHTFGKYGGNLGDTGCVSWMFEKKGQIRIEAEAAKEDELMMTALDAGATDVENDGEGTFTVSTEPTDEALEKVRAAIIAAGFKVSGSEIARVPNNLVHIDGDNARKSMKLYDAFDDHDDVQSIATNFEVDEASLAEMG